MPYLSASAMVIHYEEALYQVMHLYLYLLVTYGDLYQVPKAQVQVAYKYQYCKYEYKYKYPGHKYKYP